MSSPSSLVSSLELLLRESEIDYRLESNYPKLITDDDEMDEGFRFCL